MKKLLLCIGSGLLLGACASEPVTTTDADGKEYRTGSNIPVRDRMGVVTVSPEAVERQRDESTGNVGKRPGMGR